MELLLTLFGFFMAILANMTGIEGGMIFVPLFILLFGLSPQEAAGVSMATMVFGLGAGSLAYARQGRIDGRLGLALLAVSLPGTVLGALLTPHLSDKALELLLGLLLVPLGFRMIFRRELSKAAPAIRESSEGWKRAWRDGISLCHSPLAPWSFDLFARRARGRTVGHRGRGHQGTHVDPVAGASSPHRRGHLRLHDGVDGPGRGAHPWGHRACPPDLCPLPGSWGVDRIPGGGLAGQEGPGRFPDEVVGVGGCLDRVHYFGQSRWSLDLMASSG